MTDTTTGVYVIGINHGFEIKAPADTTLKTLKVYVGTYGAKGKFQASLSDLSAPAYVDSSLDNAANGPGGVYTINYAARSAGQTLTIKWTGAFMNDPTVGNVTLQAGATARGA